MVRKVVAISRSFHPVNFESQLDKQMEAGYTFFYKSATRRMVCDAMLQMYGAANADNYRCISLGLRFVEL